MVGVHDRLGTLAADQDIAIAAAAVSYGKTIPDADAEISKEMVKFKYKDKTSAAIRIMQLAGI